MSDVLRKKIKFATGVPPSILQLSAFWSSLEDAVSAWATASLGEPMEAGILSKMSVTGASAKEALGDGVPFVLAAPDGGEMGAVVFGQSFVSRYAALRLDENPDDIKSVSELLLRLVSERCAKSLWGEVMTRVLGATETGPLKVMQELDPDDRYLLSILTFGEGEQEVSVRVLIQSSAIAGYAKEQANNLSVSKAAQFANTPGGLRASIRTSQVTVDAILDTFELSIAECAKLTVGQVLPLENAELNQLTISTETFEGRSSVTTGALGVWKTQRAVKVTSPVPASFARELGIQDHIASTAQPRGDIS